MSYLSGGTPPTRECGPVVKMTDETRGIEVVTPTERPGARPADEAEPEDKPSWQHEQHSGEGSASALESLQKMEIRRVASQAAPDPESPAVEPDPS